MKKRNLLLGCVLSIAMYGCNIYAMEKKHYSEQTIEDLESRKEQPNTGCLAQLQRLLDALENSKILKYIEIIVIGRSGPSSLKEEFFESATDND